MILFLHSFSVCKDMTRYPFITKTFLILAALLITSGTQPYFDRQEKSLIPQQPIYIKSNGWHTGFIVPAQALQQRFPQLKQRFPNASYLEVGWGDKGFYLAKKVTFNLALAAMFWSSGSVMHIVEVPSAVKRYFSHSQIEKLCLNIHDYARLMDFISSSFYQTLAGELVPLKKGLYGNSQFYQAVGTYHIGNTCNKWTAKGLRAAGFHSHPLLKLSANSVMNYLRSYKYGQIMQFGHLNLQCQLDKVR